MGLHTVNGPPVHREFNIPTRKHYYTSITLDIQGLLCVCVRLCSAFKRLVLVDLFTQAYRNKTLLFLGGHETWGMAFDCVIPPGSRFIKMIGGIGNMKKALLCGLSAIMLLSLTACGTAEAGEPNEPDPKHTTSAVETEPLQGEAVVPSEKPDNVVEPLSANGSVTTRKPTQEELNGFFERAYVSGDDLRDIFEDEDEMIAMEMNELTYILTVERADLETPADLESQYRAWRAEAHPATSTQAPPQAEMQLFAECNEVVYALDQVNIRASYSTSSTRLGSLTRGQSITRIGTAIPGTEAEGWSRVQLSDGTIAYMVSSYLSTSKPQQQGNQNRTPPPSGGTQQTGGGTYTPPPGQAGNPTWDADSLFTDPFKGLTEEEKQALIEEGHRITEKAVEGSTSTFHPG